MSPISPNTLGLQEHVVILRRLDSSGMSCPWNGAQNMRQDPWPIWAIPLQILFSSSSISLDTANLRSKRRGTARSLRKEHSSLRPKPSVSLLPKKSPSQTRTPPNTSQIFPRNPHVLGQSLRSCKRPDNVQRRQPWTGKILYHIDSEFLLLTQLTSRLALDFVIGTSFKDDRPVHLYNAGNDAYWKV